MSTHPLRSKVVVRDHFESACPRKNSWRPANSVLAMSADTLSPISSPPETSCSAVKASPFGLTHLSARLSLCCGVKWTLREDGALAGWTLQSAPTPSTVVAVERAPAIVHREPS